MKFLLLVQPLSRCPSWALLVRWEPNGAIISWQMRLQFHPKLSGHGDGTLTWKTSCWTSNPTMKMTGYTRKTSSSARRRSFAAIMHNPNPVKVNFLGMTNNLEDGKCGRNYSLASPTMPSSLEISINFTRCVTLENYVKAPGETDMTAD